MLNTFATQTYERMLEVDVWLFCVGVSLDPEALAPVSDQEGRDHCQEGGDHIEHCCLHHIAEIYYAK